MTGRERVLCALENRAPDRIPVLEHFWKDTLDRWYGEGLSPGVNLNNYFDFDILEMGIDVSPRFDAYEIDEDGELRTIQDRFGYVARMYKDKSRTLIYRSHPVPDRKSWKSVKDMFTMKKDESARTDDILFPFRISTVPSWDEVKRKYLSLRKSGKYILAGAYGPHEATWRLHGFTETLIDIAADPGFIAEIAMTYTDFMLQVIDRCLQEGIVFDGIFIIEDIAGTQGMLFSPEHWRKIYKPRMKKIGKLLNKHGLHFWVHSCGNSEVIFPDLIECGVKVINPLEAKSGLDVRALKKKYGDSLVYFGNIDVRAMAKSDDDIEREIMSKLAALQGGRGYIFHSDHSVPPEVGFEQYQFALQCARRFETGI